MTPKLPKSLAVWLVFSATSTFAANQLSSQLEQFSQWLLSRMKPELEVMIGSIEMRSVGQYVISDFYLQPKGGEGKESIWVERLTLDVEWAPPLSVRVKSIRADQPVLRIGDRLLTIFMDDKSGERKSGAGKEDGSPGLLPGLDVRDGDARLRVAGLPPADFKFSVETREDGRVTAKLLGFRAGRVAISAETGQEGGGGLKAETVEVDLPRDLLASKRVAELRIETPLLDFAPSGMARWGDLATGGSVGQADAGAAEQDAPADGPIAVPEALADWSIASLKITRGELRVAGYPPQTPVAQMALFAELSDLGFSGDMLEREHEVVASNLSVATSFAPARPFLNVPQAVVMFRVGDLLSRKITALKVSHASLQLDRAFRTMVALRNEQAGSEAAMPSEGATAPTAATAVAAAADPAGGVPPHWVIGKMEFEETQVTLAELGAGVPDIRFRLPSSGISNVALSGGTRSASESVERVEIADIVLYSPLDPFTPVITLPSVFVEFSLAGLFRREIHSLLLLHPTIYVSKDLFWFIEQSRAGSGTSLGEGVAPAAALDWKLGEFRISHGRLAIATQGASRLALPLPFQTHAKNISFANFSDLRLDLEIQVPVEDYRFPSYQLELLGLSGQLRFGLPAGTAANNLVNTLTSESVVWRQFRAGESWVSVTYDVDGIYGRFGAAAYGGYLDGGFTFLLDAEASWSGWASGSGIDLRKFTDVATPGNLSLNSRADFAVQVNAAGPKIQRVLGSFETKSPGLLQIPRLEELIKRMPPEWSSLKRDIARIGLDALRVFRYEEGRAKFWFIEKHGRLNLALVGAEGSRVFDVVLHDTPFTTPKLWEQSFDLSTTLQIGQRP